MKQNAAIECDRHTSWVELLRSRAAKQPDQCAYTFLAGGQDEEVHTTYEQLDRRARAIAAHLQKFAAEADCVALLLPSGPDYLAAFLGCLYAGVVAVPLYPPRPNRGPSRLHGVVVDAGLKLALTDDGTWSRLQRRPTELEECGIRVWLNIDAIDNSTADELQEPVVGPDTLAFLQYTSGSTARPKGVMVSHRHLLHNAEMIQQAFGQPEGMTGVMWLPLFHDMGLIGTLQTAFLGGRCVVMAPETFLMQPVRWLQAVSRYRAHTSGGPNFAYDLCARKITPDQRATLDLSHWQVAFIGAEPVRPATLDRFVELFEPCGFRRETFYPCYGLAEATLFVSGRRRSEPIRKAAAENSRMLIGCGQAWGGQQIEIVDPESHRRCRPGTVGEIWVRGPSVAYGYWNRSEETDAVFRARLADSDEGPFLRTGDLGFVLEGELYITGRLKNLLILGGRNHYAEDIEQTVEQSHAAIRPGCCAAFSVDVHENERLIVAAEIERRYGPSGRQTSMAEAQTIIHSIGGAVMRHHDLAIQDVLLLRQASMPKTTSGKIRRHACRAAYLNGTLHVIGTDSANDAG